MDSGDVLRTTNVRLDDSRRFFLVSESSWIQRTPAIVVVVVVPPFVVVGRMISDATCRRIVSPRAFRQNFLGGIIAIVIKILGVKRSLQPVGIRAEMSKRGGKKSNRGVERIYIYIYRYTYIDIDVYIYKSDDVEALLLRGMRKGEREDATRLLERRQAGVP